MHEEQMKEADERMTKIANASKEAQAEIRVKGDLER